MFADAGQTDLLKRLFKEYLPPWSERVGYPAVPGNLNHVFPDGTYAIPLDLSPNSSLDGLVIDSSNAPSNPVELARYFDTLAPGGIGIFFLDASIWSLKEIKNACSGADFRVLFYSKYIRAKPKKQEINERGLPVPPNWFARMKLAIRMKLFPSVRSMLGNESLVVVEKKFSATPADTRLSVVLTLSDNKEKAIQQIQNWDRYLVNTGFQDTELVYVVQGLDEISIQTSFESIQRIQHHIHSISTEEERLRSGLAFARGRRVIVDLSEGNESPEIALPLFEEYNRLEKKFKKEHFAIHSVDSNQSGLIQVLYRKLLGTGHPRSVFRMYPLRTARLLAGLHPAEVARFPELTSYLIREQKGKIFDVKTFSNRKKERKQSRPVSILRKIWNYRNGSLVSGIFISFLFLFVPTLFHFMFSWVSLPASIETPFMNATGHVLSLFIDINPAVFERVTEPAFQQWLAFVKSAMVAGIFFFVLQYFDRIFASLTYRKPADPTGSLFLSLLRVIFLISQTGVIAASYFASSKQIELAGSALNRSLFSPVSWLEILSIYLDSMVLLPEFIFSCMNNSIQSTLKGFLPVLLVFVSQVLFLIASRKVCRRDF